MKVRFVPHPFRSMIVGERKGGEGLLFLVGLQH